MNRAPVFECSGLPSLVPRLQNADDVNSSMMNGTSFQSTLIDIATNFLQVQSHEIEYEADVHDTKCGSRQAERRNMIRVAAGRIATF
ncbi:predicted protein [Botrytis cinerea T4]|uniref:Uncharacterized protein n=1 Tax=Botryotinia fuckeliana (strain T4) TaxID=999810 RepID=G2Y7E9_BOTF4|nr:predicted protein [Botrytis cinerea T4]